MPLKKTHSRAIGRIQTDMFVLVQSVQFRHLRVGKLEIEHFAVGNNAFFGVGLGKGDESGISVAP